MVFMTSSEHAFYDAVARYVFRTRTIRRSFGFLIRHDTTSGRLVRITARNVTCLITSLLLRLLTSS